MIVVRMLFVITLLVVSSAHASRHSLAMEEVVKVIIIFLFLEGLIYALPIVCLCFIFHSSAGVLPQIHTPTTIGNCIL